TARKEVITAEIRTRRHTGDRDGTGVGLPKGRTEIGGKNRPESRAGIARRLYLTEAHRCGHREDHRESQRLHDPYPTISELPGRGVGMNDGLQGLGDFAMFGS